MTNASTILREAAAIVEGSRQQTHGDKERSFTLIAAYWGVYLGIKVEPKDVAHMMVLMKLARAQMGEAKQDHWVDMAGYSGIAGELALTGG